MLALAHYVERLVEVGTLASYADAARQLGVTRARMGQVLNLLNLSPQVQEALLLGQRAADQGAGGGGGVGVGGGLSGRQSARPRGRRREGRDSPPQPLSVQSAVRFEISRFFASQFESERHSSPK